jgi:hypothetical protein
MRDHDPQPSTTEVLCEKTNVYLICEERLHQNRVVTRTTSIQEKSSVRSRLKLPDTLQSLSLQIGLGTREMVPYRFAKAVLTDSSIDTRTVA